MNAVPVIITRAEPGASQTAQAVEALGFQPILSPMLELRRDADVSLPQTSDVSGLIFTSANGVRFYAEMEPSRDLPAWCVGPATAAEARLAGFRTVHESAGNSVDLANFIAAHAPSSDLPLLHVANAAATGELARSLDALGYRSIFAPLYRAIPAPSLSDGALACFASQHPAILLVHSGKGADAVMAATQGCVPQHIHSVAISERAAAPLKRAGLLTISVADAPNEEALMLALRHAAATLSV
ncbi:MAG: uroporphyrinogen-III synthase [Henriciella sp.]|nr:uroporphyrinogen-III synthase [Henriciella sp.]